MSRKVAALIYTRKAGSLIRKSLLAYMAERASDDGSGIWASKRRIALEIEASRRAVIDNIKKFVEEGILSEVGQKKHQNGWTMEYSMNLEAISKLPNVHEENSKSYQEVTYRPDPKWLTNLIKRDGRKCFYCGIIIALCDDMIFIPETNGFSVPLGLGAPTRDHLIPKSRGGNNSIDNLVLSCHSCNSRKGNKTREEYRDYLSSTSDSPLVFHGEHRQ